MLLDLVDALRCPEQHADIPLVATVHRRDGSEIMTGTLGCPICGREYPVAGGAAYFGIDPGQRPAADELDMESDREGEGELAMRAGAFLAASEGATLVLAGEWARAASALATLVPVRVYALNPPRGVSRNPGAVAVIHASRGIPLARGAARGVALDHAATPAELASAARVIAAGGRLVAPAAAELPAGFVELARDADHRVAERLPPLVGIGRR